MFENSFKSLCGRAGDCRVPDVGCFGLVGLGLWGLQGLQGFRLGSLTKSCKLLTLLLA